MADIDEQRAAMDEAYDPRQTPTLRPEGPQQITIDDRPTGALAVQVKRDLPEVKKQIGRLSAAMGEEFYYRWPVKNKDGSTDWVEGISVKGTNAVSRIYGNCALQTRAEDRGDHWMIISRFTDLETGFMLERPFQQRKGQNIGGTMDRGRALDIVFQIGVSKATRNVVDNALTEFTDYAFQEARHAIIDRVQKEPDKYRARILARLQEMKINVDRVERRHGRTYDKWLAHDMALIIAEIQAINDNMAHEDEMWPKEALVAPARPTESSVTEQPKPKGGEADQRTDAQTSQATAESGQRQEAADAKKPPTSQPSGATPPAKEQRQEPELEESDEPTPAMKIALEMLAKMEETAKGDDKLDLDGFKKMGRINIDTIGGLTEDEREELRARFTTFCLNLQKTRGKKKRG